MPGTQQEHKLVFITSLLACKDLQCLERTLKQSINAQSVQIHLSRLAEAKDFISSCLSHSIRLNLTKQRLTTRQSLYKSQKSIQIIYRLQFDQFLFDLNFEFVSISAEAVFLYKRMVWQL